MTVLQRIQGERFSEVLPAWRGRTVVIIGSGPSLTSQQVEMVRIAHEAGEVQAVAVNDAYLLAPWADLHYAADAHWHKWHTEGIPKPALGMTADEVRSRWLGFAGEKCTIKHTGEFLEDQAVHVLRNRDFPNQGQGLSRDPRFLVTGRHSGFQAVNLASLAGAARELLLGFDGQPARDGKTHFFGEHPRPTPQAAYEYYRRAFSAAEAGLIEAGVQVLNCSPGSAIDSFEKTTLEDALNRGKS